MNILYSGTQEYAAHLPPCLDAAIAHLNEWTHGRCVRRYQEMIFTTGAFTMPDPFAPEFEISCTASIYIPVKAYAWLFRTRSGYVWLLSGLPAQGYEVIGLVLPDLQTALIFSRDSNEPTIRAQIGQINASIDDWQAAPVSPVPAYLIAGHENFAHFAWNELSALLLLEGRDSGLSGIKAIAEPLAPLSSLTNFKTALPIERIFDRILCANHALHHAVLFSAGSTLLTHEAKARVRRVAVPPRGHDDNRFKIWISARLMYRHSENEADFFKELIERIAALGRPVTLILDGYSLGDDVDFPGRSHPALHRQRAAEVCAFVAGLLGRLAQSLRRELFIVDITDVALPEAIGWAGLAQFYVCHHGTQQHKIGWLYEVPGVIHAPPNILASLPAFWVADQAEGAIRPAYFPAALIRNVSRPGERNNAYNNDYEFVSCAQAVDFVMDALLPVWDSHDARSG